MAPMIAAAIATSIISSARPSPAAMEGRSAIISAFVGHAALQWARGAPPLTYGEKRNQGRNEMKTATQRCGDQQLVERADEPAVWEGEDCVVRQREDDRVEQHADAVQERRRSSLKRDPDIGGCQDQQDGSHTTSWAPNSPVDRHRDRADDHVGE